MVEKIFEGNVLWIYDYEIRAMDFSERIAIHHFSFTPPLSNHSGTICLTNEEIIINGDTDLRISLGEINQLYIGFDNVFTVNSVKNLGVFWKPLRINFKSDEVIYVIVDYTFFSTNNTKFFNLLK